MTDHWRGRRALVTGAGGFLGSHLARTLAEAGAEVTVILRDEPALNAFDLHGLAAMTNVVRGSVTDLAVVQRAVNEYEIDTCFHLAAQALVGAANDAPLSTFESNIRGTWTVLEAMRLAPRVRAVVVASSDKAYGSHERLPYTEDAALRATNPYDVSKAATDMIATSYGRTYSVPVAITRCANLYGGGDLNFSRLVPGTIRSVLNGERPVVRSDGSPLRDYLYVHDAVDGYLTLARALTSDDKLYGQAFNLGAGSPVSVLDLVHKVLSAGARPDLEPLVQATAPLRLEIQDQYLDSAKAAEVLGWRAVTDLDTGLRAAVDWYRDHLADGGRAPGSSAAATS